MSNLIKPLFINLIVKLQFYIKKDKVKVFKLTKKLIFFLMFFN